MSPAPPSEPATVPTRIALALLVAYLVASALSFWPYTVDDAFISLRYARNLVSHGELAWNLGERVEGFSNPLWTLYGAALLAVGLAPVLWLKLGGLVCAAATVPATYVLARRVGASAIVGLVAATLVATNASVALWSIAGLETTSFMLLLVVFALRLEVELAARADGSRRLPIAAALFVLVWISRPEAPVYGLYFLARRYLPTDRLPFGRPDVASALMAGLPILGYELFGLAYFGGLLPATHGAKLGGGSPFVEALKSGGFEHFLGTRFLVHQGFGFAMLWSVGFVGALLCLRRLPAAAWAMSVAGLAFIAYAFTDWMPRYRFFVPPLPFLALTCALGLERIGQIPGAARGRIRKGGVLLLVLLGTWDQATRGYDRAHNIAIAVEPRGAWPALVLERATSPWEPGRQELDAWTVVRETAASEAIACPDIGFIGAFAGNTIWDVRGLVTPRAAAFLPIATDDPRFPEIRREMLDDMFAQNPALILLPTRPQGMAPVAQRFMDALEQDPRTAERYERLDGVLPFRVVWRRRDLTPPDAAERTREALERFPTYATPMRAEFAARAGQ